jgi:hypothetical protein
MAGRITSVLARYRTPREQLLGVFDAQADLFADTGFRGCAFVRAGAESSSGTVEQAAASYRRWLRDVFTHLAQEAGATGPAALACQLHLVYDGASLSASIDHDPSAASAARTAAEALVDAALSAGQ